MSADKGPTLSIIILNWNTAALLEKCLRSIRKHVTLDHETIVVDNNSADESVELVRNRFPHVRLLAQAENLGFSRGNNAGLEAARGAYLLLLNPDTELQPGTLEALIAFMTGNKRAGIAGPTLRFPDGSLQPSTAPFPTLWVEFLRQTMLYRHFPTTAQRAAHRNELRQVDTVTGAALLIRRECYEDIGPLDPSIFMFYEDTDWCKRAKETGWEIWFVPCSGIIHVKAAASSRLARTRTLLDSQRSTIYYFRKHHGKEAIITLRFIALWAAFMRSSRALFHWLTGHERSDQRARLRAYRQLLLWSLTGRGLS